MGRETNCYVVQKTSVYIRIILFSLLRLTCQGAVRTVDGTMTTIGIEDLDFISSENNEEFILFEFTIFHGKKELGLFLELKEGINKFILVMDGESLGFPTQESLEDGLLDKINHHNNRSDKCSKNKPNSTS